MKKLIGAVAVAGLTATTALAGGYEAPVVEVEPVVVETQPASSNAGIIVPALLLLGVIAIAASGSSSSSGTTGGGNDS